MLTAMIFVKDHDRMTRFYQEGFGLSVAADESLDGYTVLVGAAVRISLHALPDHIAEQITITDPPAVRSTAAVKLLIGVADPRATRDRLDRLGAESFETSDDDTWDITDPEGSVLRIHPLP